MSGKLISHSIAASHRAPQNAFFAEGEQVARAFKDVWTDLSLQKNEDLHWPVRIGGTFGMGKSVLWRCFVASSLDEARDRTKWLWMKDIPDGAASRFLVFVKPDAEPQAIAEAMSALQVRSADRILFCTFNSQASLKSSIVRWLSGFASDGDGRIYSATWDDNELVVRSPSLDVIRVPFEKLRTIKSASHSAWTDLTVDEEGSFIYWPKLDVHMGWSQLQQLVDPAARVRAQQKSNAFNQRYGSAIKALREAKGLTQSQIAGLVDKTVRRIEGGQTRATSQAIEKLAAAHGLSPNAYMAEVAKRLKPEPKPDLKQATKHRLGLKKSVSGHVLKRRRSRS